MEKEIDFTSWSRSDHVNLAVRFNARERLSVASATIEPAAVIERASDSFVANATG
jgi:hypothetical protein